ncbi:hypothetical protein A2U01_0110723, partial [Trifolium medium]|nr:hypothetical protein [Trifolium medium]
MRWCMTSIPDYDLASEWGDLNGFRSQ